VRAPRLSWASVPLTIRLAAWALILLVGILEASPVRSAGSPIEPFFGQYVGKTIVGDDGETTVRDLGVSIEPDGDYFKISWSTATRRGDGEIKHKSYAISFAPTKRPEIYRSAMRTDMFGNRVPMDPLSGDPFVWCRIAGNTLTVYALLIDHAGSYDLQIYERTRVDNGLDLKFTRLREASPPKVLSALLERVGPPR
jgi:hypothetical protein